MNNLFFHKYSRTSIIRPSIIRISGLTEPKLCLPTVIEEIFHVVKFPINVPVWPLAGHTQISVVQGPVS